MAHYIEPMDIDDLESDFDNKENSLHHNNVIPRALACTEKGYEELDMSELNMKLRYSVSPTSSLMSKSYTPNCDNRTCDLGDASLNNTIMNENVNLTRSLNSAINKNNNTLKSLKPLPLQSLPTDQYVDSNGNPSALRSLDSAYIPNNNKLTVNVLDTNDIDEHLSLPSSSSSTAHTPDAITPTKDMKNEGDSSIIRGLKSVLNLFRPSQSPIPTAVDVSIGTDQDILSPDNVIKGEGDSIKQHHLASTPIAAHRNKDSNSSKRNSPHKDSIVFNDGLEKELQWNNETTIIFSQEKIPIHKLFFQQTKVMTSAKKVESERVEQKLNTTEYMDISYNDSVIQDKIVTTLLTDDNCNSNEIYAVTESDSEFLDCETSLSKPETGSLDKNNPNDTKLMHINNLDIIDDESNTNITNEKLNDTTESLDETLSIKSGDISIDVTDPVKEAINIQNSESLETNVNTNIVMPKVPTDVVQNTNIEPPKLTYLSDNQPNIIENMSIQYSSLGNIEIKENIILEDKKVHSQKFEPTSEFHTENKFESNSSYANDITTVAISQNVEAVSIFSMLPVVNDNPNNNIIGPNSTIVLPNDAPIPVNVPLPDDDLDSSVTETTTPLNIQTDMTHSKVDNPNLATEKTLNETQHENNIYSKCTPHEIELSSKVAEDIHKTIYDSQLSHNIESSEIPDINPNLNETKKEELMNKTQNIEPMSVFFVDKPIINEIVDATLYNTDSDNTTAPDVTLGSEVQIKGIEQSIYCNLDNENNIVEQIHCIPEVVITTDLTKGNTVENANSVNENEKSILLTSEVMLEESIKTDQKEIPEIVTSISLPEENGNVVLQHNETNKTDCISQEEVNVKELLHKNTFDSNSDIVTNIESENKPIETYDVTLADNNGNLLDKTEIIINDKMALPDSTKVVLTEKVENKVNEDIFAKQTDILSTVALPPTYIASVEDNAITIITTENKITENNELNIRNETETKKEATMPINNVIIQRNEVALGATMIVVNEDKVASPEEEITSDNLNVNCELKSMNEAYAVNSNIVNEKVIYKEEKQPEDKSDPISEDIIISENNSPYVSVIAYTECNTNTQPIDKFEEINNPFATESNIASSPPIASKGYNFNFDELDDPFATKTKIRMSPPPTSPNQPFVPINDNKISEKIELKNNYNKNRRKSQSERKKPISVVKNNLKSNIGCDKIVPNLEKIKKVENSNISHKDVSEIKLHEDLPLLSDIEKTLTDDTIPSSLPAHEAEAIKPEYPEARRTDKSVGDEIYQTKLITKSDDSKNGMKNKKDNDELKSTVKETLTNENNNTSSSEQSTYYSATTSGESFERKNVFNLPEIDDPFITRSKIACSPDSSITSQEHDVNSTVIVNTRKDFNESIVGVNKGDKDVTVRKIHDDVAVDDSFFEAKDLNNGKDSHFVSESTSKMQFKGLPTQEVDENDAAELFIDAQAFEFLMNQNKSNEVADSGKESLFLKFDPLFAGRVTSDGVVAALSKIQRRQSTPKSSKPSQKDLIKSPVARSSKMDVTQEVTKNSIFDESIEDLNATVSKPMMVVPPAVNPVITPRNKTTTPSRLNRRSLTFTSPAIAVIDRLLSLSSNDSLMGHDFTMTQASRERNEADLALTQLRELLAEKEIHVHQLRVESKELKERLATMESKMRSLEMENEGKLKKINELNDKIVENTKVNRNMSVVVEEYERTIASLIAEAEHDKKRHADERTQLIKERDEQTAHLASMEVSFSDLHSKYEKSKQLILEFKAREDSYNKSMQDFKENLTKMQTNYDLLKQHATSKLNHANQELEKLNRTHEAEVLKLNAMIKRKELHITSLEETLAQKTKANEELTAICDELINKVG